ncbi:hypothetical protein Hbl1158_14565 [Halobaculum sp. CBA1158]|uniref:hypothetical protein n=1 Tax=Halobaculum sp. CBA1158 TaxID=2904243 RepID=UPI001F218A56|nr:hypothetical protein [Halobaculum sp. CBA1158]UIO99726.1 hypothetical protein Hbl1158_14565 [Halobaculum sp. CBA1158]
MDSRELTAALEREFGGTEAVRRTVARQARDLADSGRIAADRGHELTVEEVLEELSDAPEDHDLAERWNWWIGSLETAYGGYERFTVRFVDDGPDVNA